MAGSAAPSLASAHEAPSRTWSAGSLHLADVGAVALHGGHATVATRRRLLRRVGRVAESPD